MSKSYTVFTKTGYQDSHPDVGHTVEEICRWFEREFSVVPRAWCEGDFRQYARTLEGAFQACIAAGRLIEKTPSGWVALGAEKQASMTPTLDKLERELRKGEPTSADLAMIARDETDEARHYAKKLAFCARVAQMAADRVPKSTAKPNPFQNYTAPDCDSGPSDHLNASRHQMAGMSKS